MNRRKFTKYHHRTVWLASQLLSLVEHGMMPNEPGSWLGIGFFLARLHRHLEKTMGYEGARDYVNWILNERRSTEINPSDYEQMLAIGNMPMLARWWKQYRYESVEQLLTHVGLFREYHTPGSDYVQTQLQSVTAGSDIGDRELPVRGMHDTADDQLDARGPHCAVCVGR